MSKSEVTARRKFSGLIFGLVYGGSILNGFDLGLSNFERISGRQVLGLDQWPWLSLVVFALSVVLMGFLAGYVARSLLAGVAASLIGAALLDALPHPVPIRFEASFSALISAIAVSGLAIGTALAYWGRRLPASQRDLDLGRVVGVYWKHWLWLWLPWQYFVANLIWIGTPRFVLIGREPTLVMRVSDIAISIVGVCAVGYTGLRAVQSIRADAPLSRAQSAARFIFWFVVGPMLVGLWRLFPVI